MSLRDTGRSSRRETAQRVPCATRVTIGLYDPLDGDAAAPILTYGVFDWPRDRRFLAEVLRQYRLLCADRPDILLAAGLFPLEAEGVPK